MANKDRGGMPFPIQTMILMAVVAAILVGFSFQVIIYWPLPVAVAPYDEDHLFSNGAVWGLIVGAFVGWLVGYMTDERHFIENKYE